MTHSIKGYAMTHKEAQLRSYGNDSARYQLAREGAYNVQAFGPAMTLQQAQAYQADMLLANVPVLVVRIGAI
jgi:hypothetical protein